MWLDIATAPKDGTLVRLKRVHKRSEIANGRGFFGNVTIHYHGGPFVSTGGLDYAEPSTQQFTDVWVDEDGRHLFPEPTHWMPDAKPPQEKKR
jgi:hypothetical protein